MVAGRLLKVYLRPRGLLCQPLGELRRVAEMHIPWIEPEA